MIKPCPKLCKHEEQDKLYGKGRRVFNEAKKGTVVRCTVCGTEISLSSSEIKSNKDSKK